MTSEKTSLVAGWTESRYWSFIRSALRTASSKYPPKYEAMQKARRPYVLVEVVGAPKKKGRQKWEYQCADCKKWCAGKDVEIDHIIPCGELNCFEDLVEFCRNLFCSAEGFQVLCSTCHSIKTYMEKYNVTKVEATAKKEIIMFMKKSVAEQKTFLLQHGFEEQDMKNKGSREECYISIKNKERKK